MGIASGHTFYDIHCHAFNLSHPSLYGFLENLRHSNASDLLKEVFTLSEFMPIRNLATTRRHLRNLLAVMEHDVGGMFLLMEDDLAGKFHQNAGSSFLQDGILNVGGNSYDRIILTPLLIDFNTPALSADDIYYNRPPKKLLQKQIDDTLNGIRYYLKERPKGMLEIYPFLGLNPANYSLPHIQKILNDYFGLHAVSRHLFYKAFQALNHLDVGAPISGRGLFAGLKFYPPLGFDPWPEERPEEMVKVEYLYDFCEKKNIPITTHCHDQGFLTIPLELSQQWTSPRHWSKVLFHFPKLKLNFAHFGREYTRKFGVNKHNMWYQDIIELCCDYDNVYTDISFTGGKHEFYEHLSKTFLELASPQRRVLEEKILFGSDFMINLLDIDSYYDYYTRFHAAPFSPELKHKFCSENPARFLFE